MFSPGSQDHIGAAMCLRQCNISHILPLSDTHYDDKRKLRIAWQNEGVRNFAKTHWL